MMNGCFLLRINVVPLNISHTKNIFMDTFVNLEQKDSDLRIEKINVHWNVGNAIELLVILILF